MQLMIITGNIKPDLKSELKRVSNDNNDMVLIVEVIGYEIAY